MLFSDPIVDRDTFEAGTGWELTPEGSCRGEVCIPLRAPVGDTVDVIAVAEQMGLPVVSDAEYGISAIGPWPGTGRAHRAGRDINNTKGVHSVSSPGTYSMVRNESAAPTLPCGRPPKVSAGLWVTHGWPIGGAGQKNG